MFYILKIDMNIFLYNIFIKMPSYSKETITKYLETLNNIEKIALQIAKEDLGTSFNIEKSIGFLNWIKKNKV